MDRGFIWSEASKEAAQLLGSGEFSQTEIAEKVGVDRATIWRWRQEPEFVERIDELREATRNEIRRHGIAFIELRVAKMQERWRRLHKIMDDRAEDPSMAKVAGGSTGLLVRKYKSIGYGENSEVVEEFAVDTGLLSEIREHEKQAAQELGQWIGKTDVTSAGNALQPIFERIDNPRDEEAEPPSEAT